MKHSQKNPTTILRNIEKRRRQLYAELDDFENVTRARRININIELDALAVREKAL